MTLLTIAIPSYNAQAYLEKCVHSLVTGGDLVEIIIINDGSSDGTQLLAESLAAKYSNVRVINQENKGHGGAVNTGLAAAKGLYFKVVDSDDWVDQAAYRTVLKTLIAWQDPTQLLDVLVTNFVYEKEGKRHKKVMKYDGIFPENQLFSWANVANFPMGKYIMMHSLLYRTSLLREIHFSLPEHTFYVDNLLVFQPLQQARRLYYLPVDFYRYFIGRAEQSVNERVMIERIDQQLLVNRLLLADFDTQKSYEPQLRAYLIHHLEICTVISSTLLNLGGTAQHFQKKAELWNFFAQQQPEIFREFRNSFLGQLSNFSSPIGRWLTNSIYRIVRSIYGFN